VSGVDDARTLMSQRSQDATPGSAGTAMATVANIGADAVQSAVLPFPAAPAGVTLYLPSQGLHPLVATACVDATNTCQNQYALFATSPNATDSYPSKDLPTPPLSVGNSVGTQAQAYEQQLYDVTTAASELSAAETAIRQVGPQSAQLNADARTAISHFVVETNDQVRTTVQLHPIDEKTGYYPLAAQKAILTLLRNLIDAVDGVVTYANGVMQDMQGYVKQNTANTANFDSYLAANPSDLAAQNLEAKDLEMFDLDMQGVDTVNETNPPNTLA
jgi:hypothetical protein